MRRLFALPRGGILTVIEIFQQLYSTTGIDSCPYPMQERCRARALGAGLGIQRVHVAVVRADINHPIGHGGRGNHRGTCREAPQLGTGVDVQRVHSAVVRADINYQPDLTLSLA
jgi:hypothetical protein